MRHVSRGTSSSSTTTTEDNNGHHTYLCHAVMLSLLCSGFKWKGAGEAIGTSDLLTLCFKSSYAVVMERRVRCLPPGDRLDRPVNSYHTKVEFTNL